MQPVGLFGGGVPRWPPPPGGEGKAAPPGGCRAVGKAGGLDPQPVVPRAVAGALQPEVLEAWIGLAAEMRAALVEGPDIERGPVALRVLSWRELLAGGGGGGGGGRGGGGGGRGGGR